MGFKRNALKQRKANIKLNTTKRTNCCWNPLWKSPNSINMLTVSNLAIFPWQLSALLLITMWLLERASQCDTLTQCVNRRRLRRHVRALGLLDPWDLWTLGWRAATHSWGDSGPLAESPRDVTVSAFLSVGNSNSGAVLTALTQP